MVDGEGDRENGQDRSVQRDDAGVMRGILVNTLREDLKGLPTFSISELAQGKPIQKPLRVDDVIVYPETEKRHKIDDDHGSSLWHNVLWVEIVFYDPKDDYEEEINWRTRGTTTEHVYQKKMYVPVKWNDYVEDKSFYKQ